MANFEQQFREKLLDLAARYARDHNLALATVSRRFHGTDSFLKDFAVGKRTITLRKLDEMLIALSKPAEVAAHPRNKKSTVQKRRAA